MQRLATGGVEITSQNHNYAVAADSVPDADVTHVNLNDGVVEGIPLPAVRRPSRCSTTPRPAPGPTTPATSSTSFRDALIARAGPRAR